MKNKNISQENYIFIQLVFLTTSNYNLYICYSVTETSKRTSEFLRQNYGGGGLRPVKFRPYR